MLSVDNDISDPGLAVASTSTKCAGDSKSSTCKNYTTDEQDTRFREATSSILPLQATNLKCLDRLLKHVEDDIRTKGRISDWDMPKIQQLLNLYCESIVFLPMDWRPDCV